MSAESRSAGPRGQRTGPRRGATATEWLIPIWHGPRREHTVIGEQRPEAALSFLGMGVRPLPRRPGGTSSPTAATPSGRRPGSASSPGLPFGDGPRPEPSRRWAARSPGPGGSARREAEAKADRMVGDVEMEDLATIVPEDDEDEEQAKREGRTRKKSTATISRAWVVRNVRHVGDGRGAVRCMYLATANSATR